jgi:hypothetical protein
MIQQKSEALSSAAASTNSDRSDDDDDFPDDSFLDEEKVDNRDSLHVSSVDTLFSDDPGTRSSGALIAGKKPKPDRISLRDEDDRLDNEYGVGPSKLSRGSSGGFHLPIARIKTLFDSSSSEIRYNHLGPPTFQRNTSSSSQNNGNLVDLELAPSSRRHATDVPSADWDLSKTVWSKHIQQTSFDASSPPTGDWEAPSNETTYEASKWSPSMWMRQWKYGRRQSCWWFWQISFAVAGIVVLIVLFSKSRS